MDNACYQTRVFRVMHLVFDEVELSVVPGHRYHSFWLRYSEIRLKYGHGVFVSSSRLVHVVVPGKTESIEPYIGIWAICLA